MKKKLKEKWDIPCDFGTSVKEFEHYVGRPPKDKKEMEDWIHRQKAGIDAQLDWETINRCAAEGYK